MQLSDLCFSPPGPEMLCWHAVKKCLELMRELPAPYPQFREVGPKGLHFLKAGQLRSPKPGRDPLAFPGIPGVRDRPHVHPAWRPAGSPGFLGVLGKPRSS